MVKQYFDDGQDEAAFGIIAMIASCYVVQALTIYLQWRGVSLQRTLYEMMLLVLSLKPGFDAYRVASHAPSNTGNIMTNHEEMICMKVAELFFEQLPGIVIQFWAFMKATHKRPFAVFSVVLSILSASFTTTTLVYDKDVRVANRLASSFYGMFRDSAKDRFVSFVALWVMTVAYTASMCHILSLLIFVGSSELILYYLVADIVIYLLYKSLRRDFFYWLPISGAFQYVVSFLARAIVKAVSNMTANIHFGRRTYEQPSISQACSAYLTFLLFLFSSPHLTSPFQTRMRSEGCTGPSPSPSPSPLTSRCPTIWGAF